MIYKANLILLATGLTLAACDGSKRYAERPSPELRDSFMIGVLTCEDIGIVNAKARALVKRKDREAVKHLVLATRHHSYCGCMTEGFLWAAEEILGENLGPRPEDWYPAFDEEWTREKEIAFYDAYLEGADSRLQQGILHVLEKLASSDHLLKALDDEDMEIRKKAMFHLWQMHQAKTLETAARKAAIQHLLKDLEDRDLRHDALGTLGMLRAPEAVGPLIAALKDPDRDIRQTACCYLKTLGAPEAVDPLLEALDDTDPLVRGWAIDALAALEARQAIEPVRKILQSEPLRIPLMEAVEFLHKFKDEASLPRFCELVVDRTKCCCVRCGSASALGDTVDHPEVLPFLIEALEAEKDNVRQSAWEALKKKTGQDFGRKAEAWRRWLGNK